MNSTFEEKRIDLVKRFEKLDFDLDENLKGLLQLASEICNTPVAFITLIDETDQWFKVRLGFDVLHMPRETSFCKYTIAQNEVLVISDALKDARFTDNPLVNTAPNLRFYAGAPLTTDDGYNLGTLCVYDVNVKTLTDSQKHMVGILAKQAMHLMNLEYCIKLLNEKNSQITQQNKALLEIAFIQSHEFRGPLATVMSVMNMIKDEGYNATREYIDMMEQAVHKLDSKIHEVVRGAELAEQNYML